MSRVRIGCDPEIFVADIKTHLPVPITGKIGGTKDKPRLIDKTDKIFGPVFGKMHGWALQEDGAALEFNTPAYADPESFVMAIQSFVAHLQDYVKGLGLELIKKPSATFGEDLRLSQKAFVLGCDPDFNAYTGKENPVHDVNKMGLTRFAAGHIHLGYDVKEIPHDVMAKFCDLFIGLPSIALDKQGTRRQFYGQAGNYRPKKYGIEYRTPSNYWIWNPAGSSQYKTIYQAHKLATMVKSEPDALVQLHNQIPWDAVQHAINAEDTKAAKTILDFAYTINRKAMEYSLSGFDAGVKSYASAA